MDVNYKFLDTQKIIDYMNGHLSFIEVEDIIRTPVPISYVYIRLYLNWNKVVFLKWWNGKSFGAPLIVRKRKNR